jgi:hypothetical protein
MNMSGSPRRVHSSKRRGPEMRLAAFSLLQLFFPARLCGSKNFDHKLARRRCRGDSCFSSFSICQKAKKGIIFQKR